MRTFDTLLCFISATTFVAGTETTAYERARHEKATRLYENSLGLITDEIVCDPEETSCQDDKLTFCAYGKAKVTVPCSIIFDGKPGYCDCENNQCTANRPNCYKPELEKCTKEGKMPNPTDCRKFTYCNGKKKKDLTCPEGLTYNADDAICEPEQPCRTITCNPKKFLEFVPFPKFPRYYLFCYFGIGEVRECSQPEYSMQDGKCQFQCKTPGLFKDPKDENYKKGMWHSCVLSKNKLLVKTTNFCEKDGDIQLYFNEKEGMCLPDKSGNDNSAITTVSTSTSAS